MAKICTGVFRQYEYRKPLMTLTDLLLLLLVLQFKECAADDTSNIFEGCDHNYNLSASYTYELISDNYPNSYDPGSTCRYKYTAPLNYYIIVTCTIDLNKGADGCRSEKFYFDRDGDRNLRGSEELCGYGTFTRQSFCQTLVLAYISEGSVGNFKCSLRVQPQNCYCGWSINKNIANGQEATINEYPSMVALTTRTPSAVLFCSACIISPRFMLTAAHCALFYNAEDIQALVGRHNIVSYSDTKYADVYYIQEILVHPDYTRYPVNNDIALLQTTRNIEFSRGVGPICLPPYSNIDNDFSWENVDIIGWGATKFSKLTSQTLQKITVMVTDTETCRSYYQNLDPIYETQICTRDANNASQDSCQNDSGGPVILKHKGRQYLVGIISYGKGCASEPDPIGVNTRVTSYLSWIHQIIGRSTCNIEM